MIVSFKNINNKVIKYDVNSKDKLSSVVSKLFEENKSDPDKNTIKFIFNGQILNHEMTFGEFTEENLTIIFMVTKIKTGPPPNNSGNSTNINNVQPPTVNVDPIPKYFNQPDGSDSDLSESNLSESNLSDENLDMIDKLRVGVMGTLVFIRTNPQLAELFNDDFETLMGIMASNQVRPLFEKMVSDTNDGDSEYLNELSESLINVNSNDQSDATNTNQAPSNSIQLTTDDMNNINTLVSLGFNKENVIQAYILCNKNMDMAASMLMDS